MEKLLASLKRPKAEMLLLGKPITQIFKDLISKLLIILLPPKLKKFDLEIKMLGPGIFYSSKVTPTSKKRKEPMTSLPHPMDKGKGILKTLSQTNPPLMVTTIIWNVREANNPEFR